MADETKPDEKTKKTVPGMVRSFEGIATHAQDVQNTNLDKEKRAFKDPYTATLALFTYARLTATLAHEAMEKLAKDKVALDKRIAEFETRLTTMERWKDEAEAKTAEMVKEAEELMRNGGMARIAEALENEVVKPRLAEPEVKTEVIDAKVIDAKVIDANVTPITKPKEKGGAA